MRKLFPIILIIPLIACLHQSKNIGSAGLMNIEKNHKDNSIYFDIFIYTKKSINANLLVWCQDKNFDPESRFVWGNRPLPQGLLSKRKQLNVNKIKETQPFFLQEGENRIPAAIGNLNTYELRFIIVEDDHIVFDKKYFVD
jgi:hypothetical protein